MAVQLIEHARSIAIFTPPAIDMCAPTRIRRVGVPWGDCAANRLENAGTGAAAILLTRPFFVLFFFNYCPFNTAGLQSGFFKLPVPAYSKSLYIGVSTTPG